MSGAGPRGRVEVYGDVAPPRTDEVVKLLRFRHHNNFEYLLECESLRACRESLRETGYPAALRGANLGPGKLFVQPDLAERVLATLRLRRQSLGAGDVVVSRGFEAAVLEAVRRRDGRPNWVRDEKVLDISRGAYLWLSMEELSLQQLGLRPRPGAAPARGPSSIPAP